MDELKHQIGQPVQHKRCSYSWIGVVIVLLLSIPVAIPAVTNERQVESNEYPVLTTNSDVNYLTASRYLVNKKLNWTGFGLFILVSGIILFVRLAFQVIFQANGSIAILLKHKKLAPIKMTSNYVIASNRFISEYTS